MPENFTSNSVEQTRLIGQFIGEHLDPGTVIALDGTLGAGKTHLTQGIAAGLGVPAGSVVSPTFTICIPYEARLLMLHLDAYRIKSPEEVDQLGLDESVSDGVVLVVEWASRIEAMLPPIDLKIQTFAIRSGFSRIVVRADFGGWSKVDAWRFRSLVSKVVWLR